MSRHQRPAEHGPIAKLFRFARALVPGASLIALDVLERTLHGGGGIAEGLGQHIAAIAGFATTQEFMRSWHTLDLTLLAARHHDANRTREAGEDRLFNEHLASAVGATIGNTLRLQLGESTPPLDEEPMKRFVAGAPEAFRRATAAGLAPVELDDQQLPEVVAAAVHGHSDPWGEPGMWRALLQVMISYSDNVVLQPATIAQAADACREHFVRQFFITIETDLRENGAAFASIHLRMMGELVKLARKNASDNTRIEQKVDESIHKLDGLMAIIDRRGQLIISRAQAERRSDYPQLAKIATWLSRLDKRLAGIQGQLTQIEQGVEKVDRGVRRIMQGVRDGAKLTRMEAGRTRSRTTKTALLAAAVVLIAVAVLSYAVNRWAVARDLENRKRWNVQHRAQIAKLDKLIEELKERRRLGVPAASSATRRQERDVVEMGRSPDPLVRAKAALAGGDSLRARQELAELDARTFDYYTTKGNSYFIESRYDQAVPCYESALPLAGSGQKPRAQANVAQALMGARAGDVGTRLGRATELLRDALRERNIPPLERAHMQGALGCALFDKPAADDNERAKNLNEAIDVLNAASRVHSSEQFPAYWAVEHLILGAAWYAKPASSQGEQRKNFARAIEAFRAGLTDRAREHVYPVWMATREQLDVAQRALARLDSSRAP